MKIKSAYRRPSRRQVRRANEGPFFEVESQDATLVPPHAGPHAKPASGSSFFAKETEEAPTRPKEDDEANAKAQHDEAAKEDEEESVAAKGEEEEAQAKEEEEEAAAPKEEDEMAKRSAEASTRAHAKHRVFTRRERSTIDSAVRHARQLTDRAINAINHARSMGAEGSDATDAYMRWFGPLDDESSKYVLDTYRRVSQLLSSDNLEFENQRHRNLFAFVTPTNSHPVIRLGKLFWEKTSASGPNSQGGVLVHELTHLAQKEIIDHAYGEATATQLAWVPSLALMNADNYQFFAESV